MSLVKNPYSQKEPLVAHGFISHPTLIRLFSEISSIYIVLTNKGIRLRLVGVASATKGALENKGLFDIQTITDISLTAMKMAYVPFWNLWIMIVNKCCKEKPVVCKESLLTTQHGAITEKTKSLI